MTVELRPTTAADRDWCYQLHRAAFRGYVEAIWGWDETVQRGFHDRGFRPEITHIITDNGDPIGAITVDRAEGVTYLGRITIHPHHQGHGIGTQIIGQAIEQAGARGEPVLLDVLVVNHRAHALFQRLGFRDQYRHGENDIKIRMRRDPTPSPDRHPTSGADRGMTAG